MLMLDGSSLAGVVEVGPFGQNLNPARPNEQRLDGNFLAVRGIGEGLREHRFAT
jgi:hypothetical protein